MLLKVNKEEKGYAIEVYRSYGMVTYRVPNKAALRRWLNALRRKGDR